MSTSKVLSRRLSASVTILALTLVVGYVVPAAAQVTSGAIMGTVTDAQGGVLPGVSVTAVNAGSGLVRTTVTDERGLYRLAGLPVGSYDLKADLQGFAAVNIPGLVITINLELQRNMTMSVQGLQESVTVTAEAPLVDTTRSTVSVAVTQAEIASLPIVDQQPLMLAILMPGTSTDTMRDRRTAATVGSAASFNETTVLVDGLMNRSANAGDAREDYPQSAVQEFVVNVSQAGAQFGGTTGGVVSIVTRSGTNQFHGETYEWYRGKALNRMNLIEQQLHDKQGIPKAEFKRNLYGGAFGGPLVQNRLHFFLAGQMKPVSTVQTVNTGRSDLYQAVEGSFANKTETNLIFSRVDWAMTHNQNLFARYNYYNDFSDCLTCVGQVAAAGARESPRPNFSAGHTWVLGSHAVNELRVMRAVLHANYTQSGTDFWPGPRLNPFTSGTTALGDFSPTRFANLTAVFIFPSLTYGTNTALNRNQYFREIRDDYTVTAGRHNWKAGFDYLSTPGAEETNVGTSLGTWTFTTDQFFNPNDPASLAKLAKPTRFQATLPAFVSERENLMLQFYAQDDWRPRSNLTLNLGVRYDLQKHGLNEDLNVSIYPKPVPFVDTSHRGDNNNVSPRLGLSWDIKNDGKSVVRAGYGMYYGNALNAAAAQEREIFSQETIDISNPSYPDPYGGLTPLAFASTRARDASVLANDLREPVSYTSSVGFSRTFSTDMAINLDGVYTDTKDQFAQANINTPDPITGTLAYPTWRRVRVTGNRGFNTYKALFVRLDKRLSHNYQYRISYTLSKRDEGPRGTVTNFFNQANDSGPGATDRRHALVANMAVQLPGDFSLGAIWSLRSTMPFSALAGIDLDKDGAITDYVPGTTKNQGNRNLDLGLVNAWRAKNGLGPIPADQIASNRYNNVDLRFSKSIRVGGMNRIELALQLFNVFGTDNLLDVGDTWVSNALSNAFGKILTAQNRQQAELGVRFVF